MSVNGRHAKKMRHNVQYSRLKDCDIHHVHVSLIMFNIFIIICNYFWIYCKNMYNNILFRFSNSMNCMAHTSSDITTLKSWIR